MASSSIASWRAWSLAIGAACLAVSLAHAADAPVAAACRLLRSDDAVRARFPGAVDLCEAAAKASLATTCAARTAQACEADARCAVHTAFTCDRAPCPPQARTVSTCVAGSVDRLAASVVRYPLCAKSGGTWEPYPVGPRGWRGTCSCMGPSSEAIAFTSHGSHPDASLPSPLRYFVQDRGCVAETTLCREAGGTWKPDRPITPWDRPRCEIGGTPVYWEYKLRVGFAG